MTASAPIPVDKTTTRMPNPPDTAPTAPSTQGPTNAPAVAVGPTLRSQVAENPLLSFFGLVIVALLAAAIASPHIRIDDTNQRIDRLDARMAAGFAAVDARFEKVDARFEKMEARFDDVDARFDDVDARFDAVDARFDAIELKLTALIAGLDATDSVNAAIDGPATARSMPP